MVTRTLRQSVGAHYGWKDWLVQRVTAVVMAMYTLFLLAVALYNGGFDYALWTRLFDGLTFRIATLLFGLSVIWHAWIGMRDIWMDYIKPDGLRLALQSLTVVVLVFNLIWSVAILWGMK
jgi:succinate dehydrogenase / fumarate reductase membrane anchor subunit